MNSDTGKIKVNLVNNDQWILGIIATKLMAIQNPGLRITRRKVYDLDADFNYYINWQGLVKAPKSRFDAVWFSHLCGPDEISALRKADLIIAKSKHGKDTLIDLGFNPRSIKIFKGIGASVKEFRKINIGFAGRLCYKNRKGESELLELARNLDKNIFRFCLYGNDSTLVKFHKQISEIGDAKIFKTDSEPFFETIDYYLQSSYVEGGSMDIINAVNAGIPIVSRDIGFFHDFKTKEDFTYETYAQLQKYFMEIQKPKLIKLKRSEINTWDNFREWHIKIFKGYNGKKRA